VAYGRPLLAVQVVPGLTLGILLGALVIVASWERRVTMMPA
jgi:uncharacterized membrane protein (DUF485 family)